MTVFNSVNKFKRRTINELQGLNMSIIESSFRSNNSKINMQNEARDTTGFNDFNKINRRNYDELDGLLVRVIEKSNVKTDTNLNKFKLVRPSKTYKNKIKLLFKYKVNMKY